MSDFTKARQVAAEVMEAKASAVMLRLWTVALDIYQAGRIIDLLDQLIDPNDFDAVLKATEKWGPPPTSMQMKAVLERAEKAEAQVTQERDEWKIELGHRYEEKLKAEAEAASLRERVEKVQAIVDDIGGAFPQGLSDDMTRLYLDLAAALTPTQQEEPNE